MYLKPDPSASMKNFLGKILVNLRKLEDKAITISSPLHCKKLTVEYTVTMPSPKVFKNLLDMQ